MSDDVSARLGLPYLAAGQLQKHVTLNEALTRLDALTQTAVVSRTTAAQPTSPADGALYILPPGATGADWVGRPAGALMRAEAGGWLALDAPDGLLAVVLDSDEVLVRRAGTWAPLSGAVEPVTALQNLTRLGVNTTADATNVFAARLNKTLWTALESESGGDGDLRFTFNKQGASDVLSLLFQSGWGGRAELGLIGDDDLRLKVSADGGTWRDAFWVERATGRMTFARGAARCETTVLTATGAWTPPVWARWVEAVCVGGGGGGGAGAAGALGTARYGGGGGGAGGVSVARWPVEALTGALTAVIGGGGAGGAAAGANGAVGANSSLSLGGTALLTGEGGKGGAGGSAASGLGGAGGGGLVRSNAGGDSSIAAAGGGGAASIRPDGPGGGGAGGGVSTSNAGTSGGSGGDGAILHVRAAGGLGRTTTGLAGQSSPLPGLSWAGGGGGGGGGAVELFGAGSAGASGGLYGGGGGGGGGAVTTVGTGGAGAAGVIWLTAIG
ncbi:DUF2793 domain-containing protein [Brevundimonas sp. NPDC046655]|uniref:DUF2793 domain-containing protein n=1 Tax=unclassified Brevundimonas TaxID=2622653 RepID=UPI00384A915C